MNVPPVFRLRLAISQNLLNRSESNFQHLMYSLIHPVSLIEIRQGYGFVFCLRAWRIYSAKYGMWNLIDILLHEIGNSAVLSQHWAVHT